MDGARISNAAASLRVPLGSFTIDVGVDVISFGGTKNGLMFGECVVVLNPDAAPVMLYVRKSNMQLGSKPRFVSAQFEALLGLVRHRRVRRGRPRRGGPASRGLIGRVTP